MEDVNLDFLRDGTNIEDISLEGDAAVEGLLFLTALRDECTPEEYAQIVTEAANELELYGLVESADVVLEAKNIVRMNKLANFNKIQKRAAIALAARAGDQLYEKYAKFRKLMIQFRMKIYDKYASKSKAEARKIISNARRKASAMKSGAGKSIVDKMDKQISKLDKDGRNNSAVKD